MFERYEMNVQQFLQRKRFELAGVRHVLRAVVSALTYMHEIALVHADLKPSHLLMRPEDFAGTAWSQWVDGSRESGLPLFGGCLSPRGCIFNVVVGDLGSAHLACPKQRYTEKGKKDSSPSEKVVRLGTPEYRSPDLFLGNHSYDQAVDSWSLGCVAAELFLQVALFNPKGAFRPATPARSTNTVKDYLALQRSYLRGPCASSLEFLNSLPSTPSEVGIDVEDVGSDHEARGLLEEVPQLLQFVDATLRWNPSDRLTAALASQHELLAPPIPCRPKTWADGKCLSFLVCKGVLPDDVLAFLQACPILKKWQNESGAKWRQGHLQLQVVGEVENKYPACNPQESNSDLQPIRSKHIASFARALNLCARRWLQQVQEGMRKAGHSGRYRWLLPFEERVCASVEVTQGWDGADPWCTDDGASLLHAGVTIFGSHDLLLKRKNKEDFKLPQHPGCLYVGNFCATQHKWRHPASKEGSLGARKHGRESQLQNAIMLRIDLFAPLRSDRGNTCLFESLRIGTAEVVGSVPFPVPDLAAVVAEYSHVEPC